METRAVMNKAFDILRKELSVEEYLIYLQAITPRVGNATKELRDKTEIMSLKEVIERAKEIEKELVIQRTDGTSLYTTRDLAYHRWKSSRCDRVIDVFGKDHELVSQQLT